AAAVAAVEEEFGDVLFSLVNVGRRMGVDAEGALRTTCRKFRDRWAFMEQAAYRQHRRIEDLDLDALEALWTEAKHR
ncbi:MazG nucleotide pyrophosphohydrolase domain-containing protein, partial [Eggerthella sinensis]|uniref:MazG nucleotide pyrophosphohydrolase domain-containing protein n=1 Tax=Eggerthella sinensis TaxID=242230 RepID=UPI002FD82AC8